MGKPLRHGYTTGACAAAAAKGAALLLRDRQQHDAATIELPAGFAATFPLHGQRWTAETAACYVIKDAGDDPDVTNGCQVWAEVSLTSTPPSLTPPAFGHPPLAKGGTGGVIIEGGTGIGRVTKPGLAVPPGEWAINPVPRRMISEAVRSVFPSGGVQVTLSIPDGVERAARTLNERLGILGGLSILGTTGVVKPISTKAWTDTLDAALDVAKACGSATAVLSTGRTSEITAQRLLTPPTHGHPPLIKGGLGGVPEESFIMMGDHVGYALRACAARDFPVVVLAGQFAKLLKIACGHEQTHVASSELDLSTLAGWLEEGGFPAEVVRHCRNANTAREVLEASRADAKLIALVAEKSRRFAATLAPRAEIKVLLAGYAGEVLYFR